MCGSLNACFTTKHLLLLASPEPVLGDGGRGCLPIESVHIKPIVDLYKHTMCGALSFNIMGKLCYSKVTTMKVLLFHLHVFHPNKLDKTPDSICNFSCVQKELGWFARLAFHGTQLTLAVL